MVRDVEVAHPEREVDRVDVFERRDEIRQVREREDQRQRAERARESLDGSQPQRFVEAAEPVALQVDRDVLIAERAQLARRGAAATAGSSARAISSFAISSRASVS